MLKALRSVVCVVVLAMNAATISFSDEPNAEAEKPSAAKRPKITVSKETTRFTEPLREDGSLDCLKLLNQIAGKGVQAENNAAVPVWQAIGPKEIPEEHRENFFKMLGISSLSENGAYLLSLDDYSKQINNGKKFEENYDRFSEELEEAQKKPWSKEEHPELADFLQKNEKPLNLILEASRKSRFYSPLFATQNEILSATNIGLLIALRDISKLLVARAMLNLKERHDEEAWGDLFACYRLGRLRSQGPLMLDEVLGSALEASAAAGIAVYANQKDLTAEQAKKFLFELQRLPEPRKHEEIYANEWIYHVGYIYDLAAQKPDALRFVGGMASPEVTNALKELATDPKMDWNEVLRLSQAEWDLDNLESWTLNFREREQEIEKERAENTQKISKILEKGAMLRILSPEASPAEKAKAFLILQSDNPFGTNRLYPSTRRKTVFCLAQMALALSAYHGVHKSYPRELVELTPNYLHEIFKDPFSDEDFHYRGEKDSYLLYSVGKNGIDEGGKNYMADHSMSEWMKNSDKLSETERETDDIAIRKPPKNAGE